MTYKFKTIGRLIPQGLWETYFDENVTDLKSAKKAASEMIKAFNVEEKKRYAGKAGLREIKEVVFLGDVDDVDRKHKWMKTNLVTMDNEFGMYDDLRCENCGCLARRYGLDRILRFGKWKRGKYDTCKGEEE